MERPTKTERFLGLLAQRRPIMARLTRIKALKTIPIGVGIVALGIGGSFAPANGESICIAIAADVAYVDDPGGLLGGAIEVGDLVTGTYVYESTTPDTNALPTVGDYWHATAPFGMTLEVGGYRFRTDPTDVEFIVEIVNDHGSPAMDNYLLRSYNNLFDVSAPDDPYDYLDNHLAWQLDDPTASALTSIDLPALPPALEDWDSIFGLTIDSHNVWYPRESFFIRAHVTGAYLCLEIDIVPGDETNCLSINGHGVIPVAILGSSTVDVLSIDVTTLTFGGLEVRIKGNGEPQCATEDVNSDGWTDLVCHFVDDLTAWTPGNGTATLEGSFLDGTSFIAADDICLVP